MPKKKDAPVDSTFADRYPNIVGWVQDGLIEFGSTDYSRSFVRAIDEGGMIWEGKRKYSSFEDALDALEDGIAAWHKKNG